MKNKRKPILRDEDGVAHVLGLSGGKDSTALAIVMAEQFPELPMNYLCTPTGNELPEMRQHWDRLEDILGQKIIHLTARRRKGGRVTLSSLIEDFGSLPNHRQRWCTRILKIQTAREFMHLAEPAVLYVGLRADEPERRGIYGGGVDSRFPLRELGMGKADVLALLSDRGICVPRRTDCAWCYEQRLIEWKFLLDEHPKLYEEACQHEDRTGHTFRSPSRDKWPAGLRALAQEFESGRKVRGEQAYREKLERGEEVCRVCRL